MEKLKDGTWLLWKARISSLLRRSQMIGYATGKIKPPNKEESPKEHEKWMAMDEETHGIIMAGLGDASMVDLWKVLHQVHEIRGVVAAGTALRNFATKRAKDNANMVMHLLEMKSERMNLEMMGHRIPDDQFKMWLISSLPPSWD
ncbi:hypothetical protein M378DRAFT_70767, partial [Amanita muscaria Koide BX008]